MALIIASLSLLLSLASWIYTLIQHRKSVRIEILNYKIYNKNVFFFMSFSNQSRLPIAITRITCNGCSCTNFPKRVIAQSQIVGGIERNTQSYYSLQLPISLPSLGALSGHILFEAEIVQPASKTVSFSIYTNRGMLKKMTLPLPAEQFSLNNKTQLNKS